MKKPSALYGSDNQRNLRLIVGLYRTYSRIHRNTQKLLTGYDLTVAQFGVLEALYHLGPMKIGDIIDRTLSTSGNMTVVIKNLEKEGYITRLTDPNDRRAYVVSLTTKGENRLTAIFPSHLHDLDASLANLTNDDKDRLIKLFKKLNGV